MGRRNGIRSLTVFRNGNEPFYTEDIGVIMSIRAQDCREDREAEPGLDLITKSNIASQKLTGLDVEIVESRNPELVGLAGTIHFETKNMFFIYTPKGERQVPKEGSIWEFAVKGSKIMVDGSGILQKPDERVA